MVERYSISIILDLEENCEALVARTILSHQIEPFLLGCFCGSNNPEEGIDYIEREDVAVDDLKVKDPEPMARYVRLSVKESARDKYDEATAYSFEDFIIRTNLMAK